MRVIDAILKLRPEFAARLQLRQCLINVGDLSTYFATIPRDVRYIILEFVPDLRRNDIDAICAQARQKHFKFVDKRICDDPADYFMTPTYGGGSILNLQQICIEFGHRGCADTKSDCEYVREAPYGENLNPNPKYCAISTMLIKFVDNKLEIYQRASYQDSNNRYYVGQFLKQSNNMPPILMSSSGEIKLLPTPRKFQPYCILPCGLCYTMVYFMEVQMWFLIDFATMEQAPVDQPPHHPDSGWYMDDFGEWHHPISCVSSCQLSYRFLEV